MPLTDKAKRISAFVTPDGLYQYCVMPFGMKNAPACFQRLMNKVTRDLEGVQAYIDDLVVYSDSWEDHMAHIRSLFIRLADANLTVNLVKSEFGQATIIFLGHVVGGGYVAPITAKVDAIQQYPVPETRREVMRFMGKTSYSTRPCP